MATMWRRTMLYLGLGPDDEYEDDLRLDDRAEPEPAAVRPQPAPRPQAGPAKVDRRPADPVEAAPRPVRKKVAAPGPSGSPRGARPAPPRQRPPAPPAAAEPDVPTGNGGSAVRQVPAAGDVAPKPKPVVRQVPAAAKPYVVSPSHFNHAQEVADRFKSNQPVILNLQGLDRELSRRLIDFCSGLCYGLTGHMEKVAQHVYLLSPTNVEVTAEERRRLHERGLHDA